MQQAAMALATFLLLLTSLIHAQTTGSGLVLRVTIDGATTDYREGVCGWGGTSNWGGSIPESLCGEVAWGYGLTTDSIGCDSIPAGQLTGKIAFLRRSGSLDVVCGFSVKAYNAQKAGAVAVLIGQREDATLDDCSIVNPMGATQPQAGLTTIPSFFVCRAILKQIDAALGAGKTVEVCFQRPEVIINDFYYTVSNYQTPVSQIIKDTFGFQAVISNSSATLARTNVEITAKVLEDDGTERYSTSLTIPELSPGVVDSPFTVPGLFAPELPVGTYRLQYTVTAEGGQLPDVSEASFIITPGLFAKENGYVNAAQPSGVMGEWAIGNVYQMMAGSLDKYITKTLEFAAATNANSGIPLADLQLTFYLLRVNDDIPQSWAGFDLADLISSSTDFQGIGAYEAPDDITQFELQQVELNRIGSDDIGVELDAGARYMAIAYYAPPNHLSFHAYDNAVVLPQGLVHTIVYNEGWLLGGFGPDANAQLRMYIDLLTTADEKPLPATAMQIVPNPVRDNLNLAVQFDQPTDATITIAEMSGRVIKIEDRDGLTNETLRYPLTLAAGTYLARIATKEGTLTKQFVVVK